MRTALVSSMLVLVAGCTSMEDVRSDGTGGTTQLYDGSKDAVLQAAITVLRRQGVETLERNDGEGTLFGTIPESFLGDVSSTYCGVWIDETREGKVEVRIVTRRRRALSLLTGLTESTFHAELKQELQRSVSEIGAPTAGR